MRVMGSLHDSLTKTLFNIDQIGNGCSAMMLITEASDIQKSGVRIMDRSKVLKKVISNNISDMDRYRLLFDTMKQGVVHQSPDGVILHANNSAREILGIDFDRMGGMTSESPQWDALREDGSPLTGEEHPSMVALSTGREVLDFVMTIYNPKKKRRIWIKIDAIPLVREGEIEPYEVYTIFEDITEKRDIEEELRRSEEIFRRMANNVNDIFWTMDLNLDFTYVSPSIEKFTGFSPEEFLRTGLSGMITREFVENVLNMISKTVEEESKGEFPIDGSRRIEFKMPCKDGGEVWAETVASFLRDDEGNPVGIMGITRDISERKHDEERMNILTTLIDSAPAAITVHDLNGNFLYTNRKNLELHDLTMEEFMEKNLSEIDLPESKELIAQRMDLIQKEGEASFEVEHYRKDGSILPLNIMAKLSDWGEKKVLLSIGTDISESKRAEEELKKSEERYRILVENANETILVAQDGMIKFINPVGSKLTGSTVEEMMARPFLDFIHPEDKQMVAERYLRRLQGDTSIPRYPFRLLSNDGSVSWVEIEAVMIDWGGKPATLNFLSNITERKRAEDELRKSEEWYRTLLELSPDPILIYDLSGNIIKASGQAKKMYGVETMEEFLHEVRNIGDILDEKDKIKAFDNFKRTLAEGRSEGNIYTIQVKNGSKYKIEVNSSVLYNTRVEPISFISIIRDITEQNKAREQIEFERNRAEFYLDLLSHDIGNLHQGLLAWTAILKARSSDENERTRGLAKLEELEKRSIKLVRNVLLLSRLKDMGADLSPINLLPLIKKTVKDIRSLFGDREMDITISSDLERAEVMGESVLEEVFFNLLHNGIKFQYEDPVMIEIDITEVKGPEEDSLIVSFADHGIGVADEKKDHLFDRHIKGSDYGYSGIGLSLVKELVSRYGGRLEVDDRVPGDYSKGAKFVIHFPLIY